MNAAVERMNQALASKAGQMGVLMGMYVLLAEEYYRFVYRHYDYLMGFSFEPQALNIAVGLLLLGCVMWALFALPEREEGAYTVAMIVALLFCLPSIVMYQLADISVCIPLYTTLFLLLLRTPLLRMPRVPTRRVAPEWQRWVLPGVCLLCLLPFPLAYGLNLDFSLFLMGEETYEVRAEVLAKDTLLTAYLMGPLRMVLLPMLIVYGLDHFKRHWWMAVAGVAGLLLLFMLNPQKSIFFSVAVVLAFSLFRRYEAKAGLLLYGMATVCLGSVALNLTTGHLMAESIAVRRLFFIPAIVSDNYFSFFEGHPMYLSHSFLSRFTNYPYELEPSKLIGWVMYNRTTTNCNTGIVADGFMNFGHVGALLFVAMGALFLRLVEANLRNPKYFGLLALMTITFLNSALFTALLTHGGWALLAAALFLVEEKEARP